MKVATFQECLVFKKWAAGQPWPLGRIVHMLYPVQPSLISCHSDLPPGLVQKRVPLLQSCLRSPHHPAVVHSGLCLYSSLGQEHDLSPLLCLAEQFLSFKVQIDLPLTPQGDLFTLYLYFQSICLIAFRVLTMPETYQAFSTYRMMGVNELLKKTEFQKLQYTVNMIHKNTVS